MHKPKLIPIRNRDYGPLELQAKECEEMGIVFDRFAPPLRREQTQEERYLELLESSL
jgi:hypothetical protein